MEKQKLKLKDHPSLIAIISVCLIISILLPIATYTYFENTLNSKTQTYNLNIASAQQENQELNQQIANLTQQLGVAENPLMSKPYFVTSFGWYLHKSYDPVPDMAKQFTIYGDVLNVGATDAQNCSLIIKFYNNDTLLQTSNIPIGEINHWTTTDIDQKNTPCGVANSVTRIDVNLIGDNVP